MPDNQNSTDPQNTDVWSQPHHAPFAHRTITWVFSAIAIVILVGFALVWPFGSSDTQPNSNATSEQKDTNILVNVDPETGEEVGFLAQIFNNTLKNIDTDRFDADTPSSGNLVNTMAQMEVYYNKLEDQEDGYRQSFRDIIDSEIKDAKGENAGELHDILINKDTGDARAIIIEPDKQIFDRELSALTFKNIHAQEPDGDVHLSITEENIEQRKEFDYSNINNDAFISLKSLNNGQVIDDRGEYVGEIDALIYQNAQVQNVYFLVKPSLTPAGQQRLFKMPYENLNLVESSNGYDIQLSTADTKALATALYTN